MKVMKLPIVADGKKTIDGTGNVNDIIAGYREWLISIRLMACRNLPVFSKGSSIHSKRIDTDL